MNTARIVVLVIALGAGGVAAYLASGTSNKVASAPPVVQLKTTDVLVAKADIGLGQAIKPDDLQWQTWPAASASDAFIRRSNRPDAAKELTGWIARAPFIAGEPIREQKLVKANGSGFMAAILPTGMRAVSTEISPESGAGGFILPNDRVDVIVTKHLKLPKNGGMPDVVVSKIILTNIRVLAIDQTPKEKEGQNAVIGKTVTLELRPDQAVTLALERQAGALSLALRSIADGNAVEVSNDQQTLRQNVQIVRHGVASLAAAQR